MLDQQQGVAILEQFYRSINDGVDDEWLPVPVTSINREGQA